MNRGKPCGHEGALRRQPTAAQGPSPILPRLFDNRSMPAASPSPASGMALDKRAHPRGKSASGCGDVIPGPPASPAAD